MVCLHTRCGYLGCDGFTNLRAQKSIRAEEISFPILMPIKTQIRASSLVGTHSSIPFRSWETTTFPISHLHTAWIIFSGNFGLRINISPYEMSTARTRFIGNIGDCSWIFDRLSSLHQADVTSLEMRQHELIINISNAGINALIYVTLTALILHLLSIYSDVWFG